MSYYCPWGQLSNIELKAKFLTFVPFTPCIGVGFIFTNSCLLPPWKNPVYDPAHSYFREPGVDAGFSGGGNSRGVKNTPLPLKTTVRGKGQ